MAHHERDIQAYDFDWPMVLLLEEPRRIAEAALDRVGQLDADGDFPGTIGALRQALEAIGPSAAAVRPRHFVGFELIRRQEAAHDLQGALWTCGRLILSQSGSDQVWEHAMRVITAFDAAGMEREAKEWWLELEMEYAAKVLHWDALDWFEHAPAAGSAPAPPS